MSESSRSDGSLGDHGVFATTTTTHTVSTTTTFFRLPRRKKEKGSLFPLPPKVNSANGTPRMSMATSESPTRQYFSYNPETSSVHGSPRRSGQHSPWPGAIVSSSLTFAKSGPGLLRSSSRSSSRSDLPGSVIGRPSTSGNRGRASTLGSARRALEDDTMPTPPLPQSTRTSTSTAPRPSLGGLFSLSRLRQTSEPMFPRHGPGSGLPGTPISTDSKQPSFSLPREPLVVIPERQEGDTPAKYLARLEEVVNRSAIVPLLSKTDDEFTKNVLRSYMRRFKFFEDPLDMAVRKMLMHVDLPKETQQIDRTLQSFADRYHECNPGVFVSPGMFLNSSLLLKLMMLSPDDAYFVAFSILILHTDVFNKNNKHKMQKNDYIKNAREQGGVASEILECFYDNIAYTPFIHVEDDVEVTGDRLIAQKSSRKSGLKSASTPSLRKTSHGPVDPYTIILDGRLDTLRPSLEDILIMEDPFNYMGTASSINMSELHRTFFKSGVIQILSTRSRPGAFMNQATISNPAEAQVGVVDMKVTKVGMLWRKDPKKKKTRSPWQEWGAILTGSQLYFFRNTSWIRNLMHQYDSHQKSGRSGMPVIFKPPLEQFKPDFLLSTDDVVALVDSQYKKHKHAFVFTRQAAFEEVFLADNDADMNDWLAKLNYAAAFRTAGVRMRGVIGGSYESRKSNESQRGESRSSSLSVQASRAKTQTRREGQNESLTQQVMVARRQIMTSKISEADEKLSAMEKQLDGQLRTARHLSVLAPIQARTREGVVGAALRLATNIRWSQIEKWRVKCYRDILAQDLAEDIKISSKDSSVPEQDQRNAITPQSSKESQFRSPFSRLNSKAGSGSGQSHSRSRPSNQPTGAKLFSMDEIFKTPSKLKQHNYKPRASWELPPLGFERGRTPSLAPNTNGDEHVIETSDDDEANVKELNRRPSHLRAASEIAVAPKHHERDEHRLLVEAGIFSNESSSNILKVKDIESEDEKARNSEVEDKEGLSKVRHSLHKKLQSAHVPNNHRSRKGKDSSSSAAPTEDGSSMNESEGLTRAAGSFTVHGKKASVIKFGNEWQTMTPEDRMKSRKSSHGDDAKRMSTTSALEEDLFSGKGASVDSRANSSDSTPTVQSFRSLTPTEPKAPYPIVSSSSNANRGSNGSERESVEFHEANEVII